MTNILNEAGERVFTAGSDAEAVRWWTENGRPGDYLEDTDELVATVAEQLQLGEDPDRPTLVEVIEVLDFQTFSRTRRTVGTDVETGARIVFGWDEDVEPGDLVEVEEWHILRRDPAAR